MRYTPPVRIKMTAIYRNCKQCQERFKQRRSWMVFCSTLCRVKWFREHKEYCFYCGDEVNYEMTEEACAACYNLLINAPAGDVKLKLEYLIEEYKQKHDINSSLLSWDESELSSFNRITRNKIMLKIKAARKKYERLKYMEEVLNWLRQSQNT